MTVDDQLVQEPAPRRRITALGRWFRRCVALWRPILLTAALVAATGFAAGYFYFVYRPDVRTDDAARHQAVKAASDGAVALLTYSPETLSHDLDNAKSRIADDYLPYYLQFAEKIVGMAAMRGQVTTSATVIKAAASEMHPDSAVVLVFVRQKTTSKEKPEPVVTSSSLQVTLKKVNGSWLIAKFAEP